MRVAVADHISDTFLDTLVPLMLLVEAAREGNQKEVEECAIVFSEGAAKLEEVSLIVVLGLSIIPNGPLMYFLKSNPKNP